MNKISRFQKTLFVLCAVLLVVAPLDVSASGGFPGKDVTFYGEPILGLGRVQMDTPTALITGSTATSDSGFMPYLGLNLGWQVDYVHILFHGKYGRNFGDEFGDSNYNEFGFGVGWEWNIPLITTIIYKFSGKTSVGSRDFNGGTGFEFQLGYFVSEDLKASLVFSDVSYDSGTGTGSTNGLDASFFGASLSFPMSISYPSEWWRKNL